MAEYAETNINGTSYTRSYRLVIDNPLIGNKHVEFLEEKIYNLTDKTINERNSKLSFEITDFYDTYPIRNPENGDKIPNEFGDYMSVYIMLYSIYWHKALIRDRIAPFFITQPDIVANVDVEYTYNIEIQYNNTRDEYLPIISIINKPNWLSLIDNGDGTGLLSGTPLTSDIGNHEILLKATDDYDYESQLFNITVS